MGRSVWFRYELRCWREGVIPDQEHAVAVVTLESDAVRAEALLAVASDVPTLTWGRDERGTGDMWNSNSMMAWLLSVTDHELPSPPPGARAPGWQAGVSVASARQES